MENFEANNGYEENNYDEIDRQINSAHDKRQQKQQNVHSDNDVSVNYEAVIDYIQTNPRINWKNAEVTVYDIDDNSFTITSGEGKYQYVVTDDEMGGVELINTSNKVHKPKPPQNQQPNKEPTRNLHTREKRSSNRTTGGFHPYSNSNESHHQHNHGDNTNETEGGMNCTIS
ncbi:unnamed protein product [Mytilus edulis]|uniref:Uncharacterized protein n=1 Tax=Mytilus edulis TaxID=6550 RepID=A0A8S3USV1_MYTED|nr:unnamed protein product [Mytilus edulis]